MAEDGGNLSGDSGVGDGDGLSPLPRTFIRLNDLSGGGGGGGGGADLSEAEPAAVPDGASVAAEEASASGAESLPYPSMAPVVFFYLKQTTRPRSWCLKMVNNPYPLLKKTRFYLKMLN